MDLTTRTTEIEIMDDLTCSGEVVDQTLRELEFINKWLGGNAVTVHALSKLIGKWTSKEPLVICDLGCGSGDMLKIILKWAEKRGIAVKLLGIDANPNIVEYARKNTAGTGISFYSMDVFSEEFQRMHFDVVIGTLFFHHFSKEQLIGFFSRLKNQVRVGFVINDIHRHFLAYHSIKLLTSMFSRSPMVKNDGPLSVRRSFLRSELEEIMTSAGINRVSIQWKWAFRWELIARS